MPAKKDTNKVSEVVDLSVDEFLSPQVGLKFILYPSLILIFLSLVLFLLTKNKVYTYSVFIMALGYICLGVGFIVTLIYYKRFVQTNPETNQETHTENSSTESKSKGDTL